MKKDLKARCMQWLDMGLEGLIPIYGKDGRNGTMIILANRSPIEDHRRLDTILAALAGLFQKSLDLIKMQARDITGQRTMNPLSFYPIGILVPFRMRKPIGRNDGAVGYFLHHAIEQVEEKEGQVLVILKDGQSYSVMDSIAAARHRIRCACQIREHLSFCEMEFEGLYGQGMNWEYFYNQPATRADIVMILRDIKKLTYITNKIEKRIN